MGAGKFGWPGWHDDPDWKGWWGSNPPFHTPVFVLTHHPRPPIELEGGTTFHFLDASPAEALETAREAAGGQDVRLGGGPTMIRDFAAAGLVDHMHIVVVPILLGRGVRLWDGLEGFEQDYEIEATSSPSGVTHLTFTRAAACRARSGLKHDGCDLVRLLVEREVSRVGDLDEGHVRSCSEHLSLVGRDADVVAFAVYDPLGRAPRSQKRFASEPCRSR